MNKTEMQLIAMLNGLSEEPLTKTEKILKIGIYILKKTLAGKEIPLADIRWHKYHGPFIRQSEIEEIVKLVGGEIYAKHGRPGPAPKMIRRKQ